MGVYFSQTSVISLRQGFSCLPNCLIACNFNVSASQELTALRILTCIDCICKALFKKELVRKQITSCCHFAKEHVTVIVELW